MKNSAVNIVVAFWQSSSDVAKHCWQSVRLLRDSWRNAAKLCVKFHLLSKNLLSTRGCGVVRWYTFGLYHLLPSQPKVPPWTSLASRFQDLHCLSASSVPLSLSEDTCCLFSCSLLCYVAMCICLMDVFHTSVFTNVKSFSKTSVLKHPWIHNILTHFSHNWCSSGS